MLSPQAADMVSQASEAERLAAEIMIQKRMMVDYDRKRQENTQAFRALEEMDSKKVWVMKNGFFIKTSNKSTSDMIKKDKALLDKEIEETRQAMKVNMKKLHKIRPSELPKGYTEFALKS